MSVVRQKSYPRDDADGFDGTSANTRPATEGLYMCHCIDAIRGHAGKQQRRAKYFKTQNGQSWRKEYCGAFAVQKPVTTPKTKDKAKFDLIHDFEFFLWSTWRDNFDAIKLETTCPCCFDWIPSGELFVRQDDVFGRNMSRSMDTDWASGSDVRLHLVLYSLERSSRQRFIANKMRRLSCREDRNSQVMQESPKQSMVHIARLGQGQQAQDRGHPNCVQIMQSLR